MKSACDFVLRPIISHGGAIVRTNPKHQHSFTDILKYSSALSTLSALNSSRGYGDIANVRQKQWKLSRTSLGVATNPDHIIARLMSTNRTNATPSKLPGNNKYCDDLTRKTEEWLEIPLGTWTRREVSRGRFLVREWSESPTGNNHLDRAIAQTRILRRWMEERATVETNKRKGTQSLFGSKRDGDNSDSREMVEMLNRCLDSWRNAGSVSSSSRTANKNCNEGIPQTECMELIRLFYDASEFHSDGDLLPNRKTYSMCMNVLSLYPESPSVCDDVLSLLNHCRRTTTTDLQFYSVCLHTLAKCATHHEEAPALVERIFREMTSDVAPNTACFVSVLHAWANSIPAGTTTIDRRRYNSGKDGDSQSLAAERAEAILNQMIRDYPQLVNTICFNICIDAWGRQGNPEKAEAILRRFYKYQQERADVRPNQISFNSAINAWAKSANIGGKGNKDPQKAVDRASMLLQQMKAQGLEPSYETFGSLMEAYSKIPNNGIKVQSFLNELEQMFSEGQFSHPPPKVCYLMAIQAWGRSKERGAKEAESVIRRLEEISSKEDGEWAELTPCTILYTALVSAWGQSDMEQAPDRAREIFRNMWQESRAGRKNVAPNTITRNAVLEAFCNHGRIDEAREFLERTRKVVSPDSQSFLTILKAYANCNTEDAVEKAQNFLSKLEDDYRRGKCATKPTIRMYSQILVAWGNSSRCDAAVRAEEFFWKLLEESDEVIRVTPDTVTFNCVLRAWSKSLEGGAAERAESLLKKVRDEHSKTMPIDPISHLHLIYAWAHSRRKKAPNEAEKHLEQARALCSKDSGWNLTSAHYNGTILAWKKSQDDRMAKVRIRQLQQERDSTTTL